MDKTPGTGTGLFEQIAPENAGRAQDTEGYGQIVAGSFLRSPPGRGCSAV